MTLSPNCHCRLKNIYTFIHGFDKFAIFFFFSYEVGSFCVFSGFVSSPAESVTVLEVRVGINMDYYANYSIWEGVYYHPHLFGVIMLTAALLGFSTSYLSGIASFPTLPYMLPYLGNLQKEKGRKKRIRVYMDGCFDLMHYGHANALRQAKALGDELVVGIVSDEEIIKNKGPPVLSMEERYELSSRTF